MREGERGGVEGEREEEGEYSFMLLHSLLYPIYSFVAATCGMCTFRVDLSSLDSL